MLGNSPLVQQAQRLARLAANLDAPILIVGESGTGKECLGVSIHQLSQRSSGPCVKVRCGAVDGNHLSKRFHAARNGTLLLLDAEQLSIDAQNRLAMLLDDVPSELAVLKTPLLNATVQSIEPKIVATANGPLRDVVSRFQFREDLSWFLSTISISMPSLRERPEDIPGLVDHYLDLLSKATPDKPNAKINQDTLDALQRYHWPGNIRELQCYLRRAVLLSEDQPIDTTLLSSIADANQQIQKISYANPSSSQTMMETQGVGAPSDLASLVSQLVRLGIITADAAKEELYPFIVNKLEKELISQVLEECEQVQTKTSSRLGINRNTLHKKIKEYGL